MGFLCTVCHKPLGRGRVKQGVEIHPRCSHPLQSEAVEAAFQHTERVLERLSARRHRGEVGELFAAATEEAREVVRALRSLREAGSRSRGRPRR